MTADIDLLPLPEGIQGMQLVPDSIIQDYARANVEHHTAELQAEIEALRVRADAMAGEAIKHETRAERLAEALRRALKYVWKYSELYAEAEALLRDQDTDSGENTKEAYEETEK